MPYIQVGIHQILSVSDNTLAYFERWKERLHKSCVYPLVDKTIPCGTCQETAYRLTKDRLDAISRGMPDFHPTAEDETWSKAFKLHEASTCHTVRHAGIITPTWVNPSENSTNMICDCYGVAAQALRDEGRLLATGTLAMLMPPVIIKITEEDAWYEPRFE